MKAKKPTKPIVAVPAKELAGVYERIREILESARSHVARTVNTTQVVANWLIGREIVEDEQHGRKRAGYGDALLAEISRKLSKDFCKGWSVRQLEYCRTFYLTYPVLLGGGEKSNALRSISLPIPIPHALRSKSSDSATIDAPGQISGSLRRNSGSTGILHTLRGESDGPDIAKTWEPGRLSPNLSWTHYRTLLRVDSPNGRAFYEIEAIKNNWSARELERQINSLLFERLAKSRDKVGLMKLATKGQEIAAPADVFKDPVVIEFLGLPESHRLVESDMEQALINNLQAFLLELGKGFAFVSRQERITLDGDHFYIDLVFYHTVLKCYVLIDLKLGKLTHGDLGQMQLYANYFDQERRTDGDNPTLGLILCTDKNDAVVRYLLGPDQSKKIFTSRYKLHLPTEAELTTELKRELKELR
jgi:predicted nuclease of restriction endonuclease-like (RecB) superfamily